MVVLEDKKIMQQVAKSNKLQDEKEILRVMEKDKKKLEMKEYIDK